MGYRELFIEYSQLEFEQEIGSGTFGVVFRYLLELKLVFIVNRGKWNETPVALKVLSIKNFQGSDERKKEFLEEAQFMAYVQT